MVELVHHKEMYSKSSWCQYNIHIAVLIQSSETHAVMAKTKKTKKHINILYRAIIITNFKQPLIIFIYCCTHMDIYIKTNIYIQLSHLSF